MVLHCPDGLRHFKKATGCFFIFIDFINNFFISGGIGGTGALARTSFPCHRNLAFTIEMCLASLSCPHTFEEVQPPLIKS